MILFFCSSFMKLDGLFGNLQFIEKDYFGNYKINWKKFAISFLVIFIFVSVLFNAFFILLHIFPPTDVYYETMGMNETRFVFSLNGENEKANSHVDNLYLTSDELNIHKKKIYANDGQNYSYYLNVPQNISSFKLDFYFEGEFPYVSQHIIINVKRV